FSDGISDQLIGELSRLPGLFVIARNSSFAYKGKAVSEREIAKALGVKYLLEGSIRKAAGHVRIGVNLVDGSAGTETWTQHFDRPLKDIFAVQDEIVSQVVRTLGLIIKADRFPHSVALRGLTTSKRSTICCAPANTAGALARMMSPRDENGSRKL